MVIERPRVDSLVEQMYQSFFQGITSHRSDRHFASDVQKDLSIEVCVINYEYDFRENHVRCAR